ncbi:MAG: mechanosensitive ion channel family protein [Rhizomicrobium sp.]
MTLTAETVHQMALVAWNWAAAFLPRLAAAIAIFIAGIFISRWVGRAIANVLERTPHFDIALKPIMVTVLRYAIVAFTIVATLDQIGFRTSSLLAVIGVVGIAVGLALQGTLSNIASGIMLLWLRPFQVLDYIEVGSQGGSVEEIGLFGCKLRTFDGMFLFLPNSAIWNAPLKNHTRNCGRLIGIDVSLPVGADLRRACDALLRSARGLPKVLAVPEPKVFLANLTASAQIVTLMVWTAPQGAGEVERQVIEKLRAALAELGENFKALQITRTIPPDSDPSRFLDAREPVPY